MKAQIWTKHKHCHLMQLLKHRPKGFISLFSPFLCVGADFLGQTTNKLYEKMIHNVMQLQMEYKCLFIYPYYIYNRAWLSWKIYCSWHCLFLICHYYLIDYLEILQRKIHPILTFEKKSILTVHFRFFVVDNTGTHLAQSDMIWLHSWYMLLHNHQALHQLLMVGFMQSH